MPGSAPAIVEAKLEVRVAVRRGGHGGDGRLGKRRPAEVRVQNDACGVDHRGRPSARRVELSRDDRFRQLGHGRRRAAYGYRAPCDTQLFAYCLDD